MSKDRKREKSTRKKGSSLPAFDFGEGLLKGKATEDSEADPTSESTSSPSKASDETPPKAVVVEEVTLDSMVIDDPPTEDLIIADATDSIYDSAPVKKFELPAFGFAEDLLREYRAKKAAEAASETGSKPDTSTTENSPPESSAPISPAQESPTPQEDPPTQETSFGDIAAVEEPDSGPANLGAGTPGVRPSETQTLTFDTTEMKAAIAVESTDGAAEDRIFAFADSLNARIGQDEQVKAKRLETWLTLILADELFALPVDPVRQVLRLSSITRVPHAPTPIRGVTNVRGRVIPVIDLRLRLDLPESALDRGSRIVVVHSRGRLLGLLVDAVQQVVHLDMDLVQPPPDDVMTRQSDYISGVYDWQDKLLLLLDVDRALILREASANFSIPQETPRSSQGASRQGPSMGWGNI